MTTDTPVPDSEDDEDAPLTLGTLRAALAKFDGLPDDAPVIIQKDTVGERFSPALGAEEGMYLEGRHGAEVYPTPEQIAESDDYTEEDEAPEGAVRAIVLWPVS
ncbi:hypothetical protein ACFWVB_20290 [Streptomyces microflavus]|uniref:hypothetical protein n=1 Tax=Streptomyces microflavus TaxID=1919 RepID=UPI00364FA587